MDRQEAFLRRQSADSGIERIVYTPTEPRSETPILMIHGMWHGAWVWEPWQELFAEWGWESIAFSLPGHVGSPVQRPVRFCTLNYYLRFLRAEVERLPRRPVPMGHSMGGALTQWYLKHVGDDLPAAVLVAPWASHSTRPGGRLWLAGEKDAVITVEHEQASADYYGADLFLVPEAAHDIQIEFNYRETAQSIHSWLEVQGNT